MSGGSELDYLYSKVEAAAQQFPFTTPEREWMAAHLIRVATALKAIEWEDCGDSGPDLTKAAIRLVMEHKPL